MKKRWLCDDQAASQLPGQEVDGLVGVTNTVNRYQSHRIMKKAGSGSTTDFFYAICSTSHNPVLCNI